MNNLEKKVQEEATHLKPEADSRAKTIEEEKLQEEVNKLKAEVRAVKVSTYFESVKTLCMLYVCWSDYFVGFLLVTVFETQIS